MKQFNNHSFTTQEAIELALQNIHYVNGRYVKITYEHIYDNGVSKVVKGSYRLGINYSNIQRVKDKRANDLAMGIQPKTKTTSDIVINNYVVLNKNGELKLKLFTNPNKNMRAKVDYFYNGQPTTKQWLLDNGLLKDKASEQPIMFTIMAKNLLAIG